MLTKQEVVVLSTAWIEGRACAMNIPVMSFATASRVVRCLESRGLLEAGALTEDGRRAFEAVMHGA